jgi:hypothetical protein
MSPEVTTGGAVGEWQCGGGGGPSPGEAGRLDRSRDLLPAPRGNEVNLPRYRTPEIRQYENVAYLKVYK